MTILMVDDTPLNLNVLFDMLSTRGYTVKQARDGKTALAAVDAQPPDLILLDVAMPNMNGYEVCRTLKADKRTCDIPVIFISALTQLEDIIRGFEAGGVDYIAKPFQYLEVIARVETQLTMVRQRQQIEAMRAQERQHFESLNRMKDEFIRMATHDLRNPLNVILGYARVLDRLEVAERDRPLLQQARENIQKSVDKMRTLVTNMLDLAQLETGSPLTLTPVALAGFLERCLTSFHMIASQEQVKLIYTPPPEDVTVLLDENHMTRVIDNLVSNALKYTPAGGEVNVSAWREAEKVIITVRDTGLGIPVNDLPRLFDAFYRVRHHRYEDVEGFGLGLSIVKTIVEQHGGTVEVESVAGQGSAFRVTLPGFTSGDRRDDG
jgi:signal transduction histidine kinase